MLEIIQILLALVLVCICWVIGNYFTVQEGYEVVISRNGKNRHVVKSGLSYIPNPLNEYKVQIDWSSSMEDGRKGTIIKSRLIDTDIPVYLISHVLPTCYLYTTDDHRMAIGIKFYSKVIDSLKAVSGSAPCDLWTDLEDTVLSELTLYIASKKKSDFASKDSSIVEMNTHLRNEVNTKYSSFGIAIIIVETQICKFVKEDSDEFEENNSNSSVSDTKRTKIKEKISICSLQHELNKDKLIKELELENIKTSNKLKMYQDIAKETSSSIKLLVESGITHQQAMLILNIGTPIDYDNSDCNHDCNGVCNNDCNNSLLE